MPTARAAGVCTTQELLTKNPDNKHLHLFIASCHYYLQSYEDAEAAALKGPANPLQNRILFHVAHKRTDENKLMQYHQKLGDSVEDQLSLASIHYLRSHFQEVRSVLTHACDVVACSPACCAGRDTRGAFGAGV